MNLPTWLRQAGRHWFVRRPPTGAHRRVPLQVERLEDRLTPVLVGGTPAALINAINTFDDPNLGSRILETHGGVHRISLSALRVAGRHPVYEDRAGRGSSLPGLSSAGPKGPGSPCHELDGLLHVLCGNFPPAAVGTYHARGRGGGRPASGLTSWPRFPWGRWAPRPSVFQPTFTDTFSQNFEPPVRRTWIGVAPAGVTRKSAPYAGRACGVARKRQGFVPPANARRWAE